MAKARSFLVPRAGPAACRPHPGGLARVRDHRQIEELAELSPPELAELATYFRELNAVQKTVIGSAATPT